ncbi:MAG: ABC transporter ATP-binding protein [Devosia sp.]
MPEDDAMVERGERPVLEVRNLSTRFHTHDGVVNAVNDVSFHVMPGETLGVVGESGCGKSITGLSIMRLVADPPGRIEAGEVLLEGRDVLKLSDRAVRDVRGREIAMIFQDPMTSLNPVLTVARQIGEMLRRHMGLDRAGARARTVELLAMVGIPTPETRLDQFPHQFSGGMRQRVMIAMALSCNPKVLIADEPTTALDVTIQAQILDLMRALQARHRTGVMMITHSMGVVAGIADRVQVMYAGSIVETASTEEIFANPRHPYTVGLLQSIPRLDSRSREPLKPIRGLPPDLSRLSDRCAHVRQKCLEKKPPLLPAGPAHLSACWFHEEISAKDLPGRAEAAGVAS